MSLEIYIKQHEALVDQLGSHGKVIEEGDRILSLIQGLPDRFKVLIFLFVAAA